MVVNFRVNHTPLVLTGEIREMQENGTPARQSLFFVMNIDVVTTSHYGRWFFLIFFRKERMIYFLVMEKGKFPFPISLQNQLILQNRIRQCLVSW